MAQYDIQLSKVLWIILFYFFFQNFLHLHNLVIHYNAIKISLCKLISCNFPFELPFNITLAKVADEIGDYLKRSWILFPHWPPWCKFSEALCHAKKLSCTQDECNPWPKNAPLCTKSLHYLWMQEWIMFLHRLSFNCFSSLFGYLAPDLCVLRQSEQLWFWHWYLQVFSIYLFQKCKWIKMRTLYFMKNQKRLCWEKSGGSLCIEPKEGCL